MTPTVGFLLFLAVTLALLGCVVFTGLKARRRIHLPLVVCAVASLGVTIYFAEKLGHLFDLKSAGAIYPIHLFIAKTTTAFYIVPVITGIMTIRNPTRRSLHRKVAITVLALTVLTAVTGTAMVMMSDRRPC